MEKRLIRAANRLASVLYSKASQKVVFAESCTGGLVSASMASVPGISNYLCGSIVAYRESAKRVFLDVDEQTIREHTTVSRQVTEQMAINTIEQVAEATWSGAITGHLGPGAPVDLDGKVFVAIARRHGNNITDAEPALVDCQAFQLAGEDRMTRQREAAFRLIDKLTDLIKHDEPVP